MATATDVLRIAAGEIGYYAPADPRPGSKYGRWLAERWGQSWLAGPSTSIWWCCLFVSWVLDQAGQRVPGFPTYNTDLAWARARSLGVDKASAKAGDIVIFDWNRSTAETDHIGFVERRSGSGTIQTIEGNTSGSDWGSQHAGNGVHRRSRSLSLVRYCIRPQYGGGTVAQATTLRPKNNASGGKLDVDGDGGYNTIYDLQAALGTRRDGVVSGQRRSSRKYFPAISAVDFGPGGSDVVRAMQRRTGAGVDGDWGPETSTKMQRHLIGRGYSCGPSGDDGLFGPDSTRALQRCLNDGRL